MQYEGHRSSLLHRVAEVHPLIPFRIQFPNFVDDEVLFPESTDVSICDATLYELYIYSRRRLRQESVYESK